MNACMVGLGWDGLSAIRGFLMGWITVDITAFWKEIQDAVECFKCLTIVCVCSCRSVNVIIKYNLFRNTILQRHNPTRS